MAITIASSLNDLQKFLKTEQLERVTSVIPTGVVFNDDGKVVVKHHCGHEEVFSSLGRAAGYIHTWLVERTH